MNEKPSGENVMISYIPTLSALQIVLDNYCGYMTDNQRFQLLNRIKLIHSIVTNHRLR